VKELLVLCPHCAATATTEQSRRTALGYRTCRCRACRRVGNERTGTPDNHLPYPPDLVLLVVLWHLRDTLRLRDLAEMFLNGGSSSRMILTLDEILRCRRLRIADIQAKSV